VTSADAFSLVYALNALIALAAFAAVWRRRDAPGAGPLLAMLLAVAWWGGCNAVEMHLVTVGARLRLAQVQYLGIVATAPSLFHLALALSGLRHRLTRPVLAAVWGIPVLSLLVAWTNPWHQWMWTGVDMPAGALPFATYHYGWWFWVLVAHSYLLLAAATFALYRAIRVVSRDFRAAMLMIVVVILLPWAGNVAYNLKLGPWPGFDWMGLALGTSGVLLAWVVLREGLFDLLPRARGALLEMMTDGVLVLDRAGEVIFTNQAARDTLHLDGAALAGVLGVASLQEAPFELSSELAVGGPHPTCWLDVRIGPIVDRWGARAGRLVVARDITLQKALEEERERLIEQLRSAIHKVTRLEGLLPICASCRKVRDDAGYWKGIEDYFGSRAPVEFTHSICPDCSDTLYPELRDGQPAPQSGPPHP